MPAPPTSAEPRQATRFESAWVENDFRAYLRCGILAYGFGRARCTESSAERLVAFSCKGRGVCPSCNARRMGKVAAPLSVEVLPALPVRQWVFSLPKRLRPFLPLDSSLTTAVLGILLRAIRTLLRNALRRRPPMPSSAASPSYTASAPPSTRTSTSTSSSSRGLFSENATGELQFHPAGDLGSRDLQRLQQTLPRGPRDITSR